MNVARVSEREYHSSQRRSDIHVVRRTREQAYDQKRKEHVRAEYTRSVVSNAVIISLILFAFVAGIAFLSIQLQISSVQRDIDVLENEIFELTRVNRDMQSAISTAANIESIRQNASLIGMSNPTEDQLQRLIVDVDGKVVLSASYNN